MLNKIGIVAAKNNKIAIDKKNYIIKINFHPWV